MKDTPPEVNAMLFAAMMRKTPAECLLMASEPPVDSVRKNSPLF